MLFKSPSLIGGPCNIKINFREKISFIFFLRCHNLMKLTFGVQDYDINFYLNYGFIV